MPWTGISTAGGRNSAIAAIVSPPPPRPKAAATKLPRNDTPQSSKKLHSASPVPSSKSAAKPSNSVPPAWPPYLSSRAWRYSISTA